MGPFSVFFSDEDCPVAVRRPVARLDKAYEDYLVDLGALGNDKPVTMQATGHLSSHLLFGNG